MPNYTVVLNNNLTAAVQTELDRWNAEQTAILAAHVPPEVHTALTVEQFLDMRVKQVAQSYKDQNSDTTGGAIKRAYNNATPEQQAAVKLALGLA